MSSHLVLGALGGAAVGAVLVAPFASVFGAATGGVRGGARAHSRVDQERGAAVELQSQVQVAKAQAFSAAQTPLVAQGSAMNMASPRIQADSVQYDGRSTGQGLDASYAR